MKNGADPFRRLFCWTPEDVRGHNASSPEDPIKDPIEGTDVVPLLFPIEGTNVVAIGFPIRITNVVAIVYSYTWRNEHRVFVMTLSVRTALVHLRFHFEQRVRNDIVWVVEVEVSIPSTLSCLLSNTALSSQVGAVTVHSG